MAAHEIPLPPPELMPQFIIDDGAVPTARLALEELERGITDAANINPQLPRQTLDVYTPELSQFAASVTAEEWLAAQGLLGRLETVLRDRHDKKLTFDDQTEQLIANDPYLAKQRAIIADQAGSSDAKERALNSNRQGRLKKYVSRLAVAKSITTADSTSPPPSAFPPTAA